MRSGLRVRRLQRCIARGDARRARRDFGKIDALVHAIAFANKEDLARQSLRDVARRLRARARRFVVFADRAGAGAARRFNDGASVMALTYLGATQIVPELQSHGHIRKPRSKPSSAIWPSISASAAFASTRFLPDRSRPRARGKSADSRAFSTSFRRSPRCTVTSRPKTSATPPSTSRRILPPPSRPTCISWTPAIT